MAAAISISIDLANEQAGSMRPRNCPAAIGTEFEARTRQRAAFVASEDLIEIYNWRPTCSDDRPWTSITIGANVG